MGAGSNARTRSWYLDPVAAQQKRQVHQAWVRAALPEAVTGIALKTDLFEEAYGADRIFDDLFPHSRLSLGLDRDEGTVGRASGHWPTPRSRDRLQAMVCDVRRLALRDSCVDAIVSTSTLDHFQSRREIENSLDELCRVLRPGGTLLITLDNPRNLLYSLLRWWSSTRWAPVQLGATASLEELEEMLASRGFADLRGEYLIHNPRGISTLLFLGLRKLLGRFADLPIRTLLMIFAVAGRLPLKSLTGCFVGVAAVKKT